MAAEDTARKVLAEVGVWWPAADEAALRHAADDWDALAHAIDDAAATSRGATSRALTQWRGDAADRFAGSAAGLGSALGTDAEAARALARSLRQFADAVADAVRELEEQAALLGASIVAGTVLAVFTFGVSEIAAAGVTAALISAAEAIGVTLTDTVAAIAGGTIAGIGVGAVEGAAVDAVVLQPIRVEIFGDGGYSLSEVGENGLLSAPFGALGGGLMGSAAARGTARVGRGELNDLKAWPDLPSRALHLSRIRAALDPPNWGPQGRRYAVGVHERQARPRPATSPKTDLFSSYERRTAELLASEGKSVTARPESTKLGLKSPDALVRTGPTDHGTYTEFKAPRTLTSRAVKDEILAAGKQLHPYGGGEVIVDGRTVGITEDVGKRAVKQALGQAAKHGQQIPTKIRIILADGTSVFHS